MFYLLLQQGTIAEELLDQVPDLDAILVPCSGAGMLAGICIAAKAIKPNIKCEFLVASLQNKYTLKGMILTDRAQ